MNRPIRRLNDRGRDAFRSWLENDAEGAPPLGLLDDPERSVPLHPSIPRPTRIYEKRYDLGAGLVDLLEDVSLARLQVDAGLWDWLSLCLIDQICPADSSGRRKLLKIAHYLLDLDNHQRRNRHLVRTAWSLVQVHGRVARYLLAGPLHEHSDVVEQLSAYQDVVTCRPLIAAVGSLVWDEENAKLKRGFAGRRAGSARRVPVVAKQFRLTYDLDSMRSEQILALLPREFDRFRSQAPKSEARRSARSEQTYHERRADPNHPHG